MKKLITLFALTAFVFTSCEKEVFTPNVQESQEFQTKSEKVVKNNRVQVAFVFEEIPQGTVEIYRYGSQVPDTVVNFADIQFQDTLFYGVDENGVGQVFKCGSVTCRYSQAEVVATNGLFYMRMQFQEPESFFYKNTYNDKMAFFPNMNLPEPSMNFVTNQTVFGTTFRVKYQQPIATPVRSNIALL